MSLFNPVSLFKWSALSDLVHVDHQHNTKPHKFDGTQSTYLQDVERKTGELSGVVKQVPSNSLIPLRFIPLFGDYHHGNNRSTVAVCAIYAYCMVLTLAVVLGFCDSTAYYFALLQMLALPATVSGAGHIAMIIALATTGLQLYFISNDYVRLLDSDDGQIPFLVFVAFQGASLLSIVLWDLLTWAWGPGITYFNSPVNGEVNAAEVFQYAVKVVRWRPQYRFAEWKAINKHTHDLSRLSYFSKARRWLNEIVAIPVLSIDNNFDWTIPQFSHSFWLPNTLPLVYYMAVSCGVAACIFIAIIVFPLTRDVSDFLLDTGGPVYLALTFAGVIILVGHIGQVVLVGKRCVALQRGTRKPGVDATPYLAVNFVGSTIMGHTIAFFVLFFAFVIIGVFLVGIGRAIVWRLIVWVLEMVYPIVVQAIGAQILLRVIMSRIVADESAVRKPYLFSGIYLYVGMASTVSMLMVLLRTLVIYVIILPISAMFPLFPLFSMMPSLDPAYTGLWAALSMHNTARNPLKITMVGYMLARAEIRSITRKAVLQFGLDRCVRMSGLDADLVICDSVGSQPRRHEDTPNHPQQHPASFDGADLHVPHEDVDPKKVVSPPNPLESDSCEFSTRPSDTFTTTSPELGRRIQNNTDQNDNDDEVYVVRLSDIGNSQRFLHLTHSIRLWVLFRAGLLKAKNGGGDDSSSEADTIQHDDRHHQLLTTLIDTSQLTSSSSNPHPESHSEAIPLPWGGITDGLFRDIDTDREDAVINLHNALKVNLVDRREEHAHREEVRQRRAEESYLDDYHPIGLGDDMTSFGGSLVDGVVVLEGSHALGPELLEPHDNEAYFVTATTPTTTTTTTINHDGGDSKSTPPPPSPLLVDDPRKREECDHGGLSEAFIGSDSKGNANVDAAVDDHRRSVDTDTPTTQDYNFSKPLPWHRGSLEDRRDAAVTSTHPELFNSLPGQAVPKAVSKASLQGIVRILFDPTKMLVPLRAILQTSEAKDMLSELQHRRMLGRRSRGSEVPEDSVNTATPADIFVQSSLVRARYDTTHRLSPYRRKLRVANRWLLALMLLRYPSIRPLRKHALRKTQYTPAVPMLRGVLESHCGQSGGCCCCFNCTSCE